MEVNRPARRRWFQFSLRTFLIVITLVGFGGAWIGMRLQQKRRHEAVWNEITNIGGRIYFLKSKDVPAWKEWLFGSYAIKPVDLYLYSTDETDSLLSRAQGMNLVALDLNSSDVTDAGMAYLKGSPSLDNLYLSNTQVTDAGLRHLKGMVRLRELYLSNTWVSDTGMAHLEELTSLAYLSLKNTQVTPAGLEKLRKALPGCEIDYSEEEPTFTPHFLEPSRLFLPDFSTGSNPYLPFRSLDSIAKPCENTGNCWLDSVLRSSFIGKPRVEGVGL